MNRTLREATVKRYRHGGHDQPRNHPRTFLEAYNFAKRLKTLKGLTPFEFIVQCWTDQPDRFKVDPTHHAPGLKT